METRPYIPGTVLVPFCLNRTMQYGNYGVATILYFIFYSLNRTMQYGNMGNPRQIFKIFRFKSYYVVWKPFRSAAFRSAAMCLNRTMQYGNFFLKSTVKGAVTV